MTADKHIQLLDSLRSLLEKQIELIQQGNISQVEALGSQANSLVEEIAQSGILQRAEFEDRRKQLQKLFDSLRLALAAQKADTAERLSRLRKGKRLLGVYIDCFSTNKA